MCSVGGEEFQTGICISGASVTTECQLLSRNFQRYFRRQGAESDLMLRVVDTPPTSPRPHSVYKLCPEGVHVLVLVLRADLLHSNTHLEERVQVHTHTHTHKHVRSRTLIYVIFWVTLYILCVQTLFGPEWRRHALLVLTHADHLKKAGLHQSVYLTQTSDWLRALAGAVEGGVFFLDNSCEWPSIRGRPLRDQLLRLSARNHHRALTVRTEVSL